MTRWTPPIEATRDEQPRPATGPADTFWLRRGGTYLITGGLSGPGLRLTRHLAPQHGARIVLTGRSALDARGRHHLDQLQTLGAEVLHVRADVSDEPAMREAVRRSVERFGAIHGAIHAAGAEGAGSVLDADLSRWREALASSVQGAQVLDRVLEGQPLDFLCFVSRSGSRGDIDAGGDTVGARFLRAYARQRNERVARGEASGKTIVIAASLWGPGDIDASAAAPEGDRASDGQLAPRAHEGVDLVERLVQPIPTGRDPAPRAELRNLSLAQCVLWDLKQFTSEITSIAREELDEDENLAGVDSIGLTELASRLSAHFQIELTPVVFYSHSTLTQLGQHLLQVHGERLRDFYAAHAREEVAEERRPVERRVEEVVRSEVAAPAGQDEPIAIIGMSGRFPGARTVDELWRVLREGRTEVREIPVERFDWRRYHGDPQKEPGKTNARWLGAVDGVDEFDPLFFEISPREAQVMDPRQRLLLQEAWRALEDAAYGDAQLDRERVGMFVGVERGDYADLTTGQGFLTANHDAILASRLAYALNLRGPAMAINTACSSGLVAVHLACQSIRSGDCDSAVAAAVNLLLTPTPFVAMGQAGMLSGERECRAFDRRASGLVPGEAVVAVVLKRLRQAEADGDPIHGVIVGSGVNYDGKTNGITAPSGAAQARLLRETYERCHVRPESIDHVVTHGTGTRLGDPVEVNALTEAFRTDTDARQFCALTSTKTNVGHTLAASGLVSLVGLVQAIKHRQIPPSLHCEEESEYIHWSESPFYVNKTLRAWPRREGERLGAVSSFGISGTNAHVVVRSHDAEAAGPGAAWTLLALSARTAPALQERAQQLIDALQSRSWTAGELQAMSYTLLGGRQHHAHRAAVVVKDRDDAVRAWGQFTGVEKQESAFKGQVTREFQPQAATRRHGQELLGRRGRGAQALRDDLQALAGLYCQGYQLDWSELWGGEPPRRLSLPTYPFARERYWVESAPTAVEQTAVLHPLVQHNTSSLNEQRYSSTFSGEEFFLRDHRVQGRKVLPSAAQLEMALQAVHRATGHEPAGIRLEQIVFARLLAVDDAAAQVHIALRADEGGEIHYEIYGDAEGEGGPVYGTGRAVLGQASRRRHEDLGALRSRCDQQLDSARLYADFARNGLDYGAAFRGLKNVLVGQDRGAAVVVGDLELPDVVKPGHGQYALHPSLLDAALQASVGLMAGRDDDAAQETRTWLPFALDRLEVFAPVPAQASVVIRHGEGQRGQGAVQKLDISVLDASGQECVRLGGFTSRAMHDGSSPREASVVLLRPTWQARPPVATRRPPQHHHVILCGAHVDGELERANVHRLTVQGDAAASYGDAARQLLNALQAIQRARPSGQVLVQLVAPAHGDDATLAGLGALLAVAGQEIPQLVGQVLQVEDGIGARELEERARAEAVCPAARVRHRDQREVLELVPVTAPASPAVPLGRDGGIYLITGGAGALGLIVARALATQSRDVTLILAGRGELGAERQERLAALEREGARVAYERLDVSERGAVRALVQDIAARHGSLSGVFHGAGVLRDGLLLKTTERALEEVLAPKVRGLVNLDEETRDMALESFVAFSSASAVMGNVGQAGYAAANAFMDEYMRERAERVRRGERKGLSLSINWPVWAEGGMQLGHLGRERMSALGLAPLDTARGVEAMQRALQADEAQIVVLSGDARRISALTRATPDVDARPAVQPPAEASPAGVGVSSDVLRDKAQRLLLQLLSDRLKLSPERIDPRASLEQYGVDSLVSIELVRLLEESFGPLSKSLLFEYRSIQELGDHLVDAHRAALLKKLDLDEPQAPLQAAPASSKARLPDSPPAMHRRPMGRLSPSPSKDGVATSAPDSIAIIGLSGRYPKARDLGQYWANLVQGVDCITEVPPERWDHGRYFDPRKGAAGKSYGKWGGFIDGVGEFDPLFFSLSPREAVVMDPQERLFLESVYEAFEDAGITRELLQRRYEGQGGVYVGAMYQEYRRDEAGGQPDGLVTMPSFSAIANRASQFFGLEGPSIAIDTMCSSAALAIHLACKDLRQGECQIAIAGGVNLSIHPNKFIGLSQAQMLGSHPDSRGFGDGDGFLPAEGVGAVVLKPLARARADGDEILAVIKGSATVHSGGSSAYAAPNPHLQARVIRQCLKQADVEPRTVSYVEAAANGSGLADAVEVSALSKVFEAGEGEPAWCAIGSAKASIGHPEAVSGMAQLSKVVLQLQHRQLVPTIKAEPMNPHIQLERTAFALQRTLAPWPQPAVEVGGRRREVPRRALINSFGAGGSYVSLLLEESPSAPPESTPEPAPAGQVIALSARTSERLQAVAAQLLAHLEENEAIRLQDLAYTLQLRREAMEMRLALVAKNRGELLGGLREYLEAAREGRSPATTLPMFTGDIDEARPRSKLLMSSTHEAALLETLVAERDLERLAMHWTQGAEVPWEALHAGARPRTIKLPTYPFTRQRFWFAPTAPSAPTSPHPPALPVAVDPGAAAAPDADEVDRATPRDAAHVERLLRLCVSEALGIPEADIPAVRSLHALGLNSVQSVALKHGIEQKLGCDVPLGVLGAEEQSIAGLTRHVLAGTANAARAPAGDPAAAAPTMTLVPAPTERHAPFPLGDVQESFLAGRLLGGSTGDPTGAHIYLELEVTGGLDLHRLGRAWQRLIERHEMLRAVITEDGQQRIQPSVPPYRIRVIDLRDADPGADGQEITRTLEERVYRASEWPLFDVRVSLHPGRRQVIHFSIDELIVDAQSLDVLLKEWSALYADPRLPLAPLEVSFRDYVLALKAQEGTPRDRQDLAYWLDLLADMPSGPELPSSASRSPDRYRRTRLHGGLGHEAWARLKSRAAALRISPSVLLLTVFGEVLRAASASDRFALVLTYFNRVPLHPQIDRMVAPVISTNFFVVEPAAAASLEELLQRHQQQLWANLDHAGISGVRVLRELKARHRLPSRFTLPVVFTSTLHNPAFMEEKLLGDVIHAVNQTPQVYLDHQVTEREGRLQYSWDVARELYAPGLIDALFAAYGQALQALADDASAWSLNALAASVQAALAPAARAGRAELEVIPMPERATEPFALTDQQQAYAFGRSQHIAGGGNSCQLYQEIEIERLDPDRLQRAWARLVQRHPMLRTRIGSDGQQRLLDEVPDDPIPVEDLRSSTPEEREAALRQTRQLMVARVAPLDGWPYFELRVSRLTSERWCVHLCLDLLVADAHSIRVLVSELMQMVESPEGELPPLAITFADYIRSVDRFKDTPAFHERMAYWERKFADLPGGPRLPAVAVTSAAAPDWARHQRVEGVLTLWSALQAQARRHGLAPNAVLMAAYLEVLAAWNAGQPLAVVVPVWQRLPVHPQIDRVVGDFTALAWITHRADGRRFEERARQVQQELEGDLAQRPVSGLSMLRRAALRRRGEPLTFPVVFTDLLEPTQSPGGPFALGDAVSKTPQVYLDNISAERADGLHCAWDYVAGVYAPERVRAMFEGYLRVLDRLAQDPGAWSRQGWADVIEAHGPPPADDEAPPAADDGGAARRWEATLHALIEAQAARTPHAPAVRFGREVLSYAELEARANRCAHYLREMGVGPDVVVGVLMERSTELVVALLAILKAGGAYLPLGTDVPPTRLRFLLDDAAAAVVLTQEQLEPMLRGFQGTVRALDGWARLLEGEATAPARLAGPSNLAYVIYTSGSTGQPKGCMLTHAAICNRLLWMQDEYGLTEQDRVLQKTPYTFDVSVWEFFWPLMTGASVVLASPEGHRDANYLARFIRAEGITVCHFVPSMLRFFLGAGAVRECTSLRAVFASGEALPLELVQRFQQTLEAGLHNLYGPTEAAVDVSYWACEERPDGRVPIGRAIDNIELHVLDAERRATRPGDEGELYIGGVGLARGYLDRPDLTAERFVPHPSGRPGERLYRTGDRACELADGNIDFRGRDDFQVKLRGLRIELGEIESVLRGYPGVTEAAVLVRDEEEGDPKLVAYVETPEPPPPSAVRQFAGERLPEYMVPTVVVGMPQLPVTVHGKLDRAALPWPPAQAAGSVQSPPPAPAAAAPPRTAGVTERLLEITAEALRVSGLEPDADLFSSGATSLTMVRVAERIQQTYGIEVPVQIYLDSPTVRRIADYVSVQVAVAMPAAAPTEPALAREIDPGPAVRATAPPLPKAAPANRHPSPRERLASAESDAIAIISLSGAFAQAPSLDDYWKNLVAGKDAITEIPPERWSLDGFYCPDTAEAVRTQRSHGKHGGFIPGVDRVDLDSFGISQEERRFVDWREFVFLQTASELLERAGHTKSTLASRYGSDVGVFVGAIPSIQSYFPGLERSPVCGLGPAISGIATRVSRFFDLKSPSLVVDTCSSSSLAAVHVACENLLAGKCQMAIAGGITLLFPELFVMFTGAGMLARDPSSRSFLQGDGMIPSEAVGAVLLKPLSRAIADKDPIHAVIRSSAMRNAGRGNGLLVPSAAAQAGLLEEVLRLAEVDARTISHVEATANGSPLGDALEFAALTQVFARSSADSPLCSIGAAKSGIGHAEAASGISQLIKTVLQLQHRQLVPVVGEGALNPKINFKGSPFRLQRVAEAWNRPIVGIEGQRIEVARRALVSSYGTGGTYVSLVLEEAPETTDPYRLN